MNKSIFEIEEKYKLYLGDCLDILKKRVLKPKMQMRSVWALTSQKKDEKQFGKHPTQKPIDLLKRIILTSTKEGDLVLDPFCGSSTTKIAAYILNRRFVGIDTEKKYIDLSIKRFEEVVVKYTNHA